MPSANKIGVTKYETPTDLDIVVTRVVDAPRRIVFDAYTNPIHLRNWMLGPEGWTMPICELDARPGGAWRYVWRKGDAEELTLSGIVREFVPSERIVTTERWGPEWPETINTVTFVEDAGQTTITTTVHYPSKEARDGALQSGMKEGMDQSFSKLDNLVRTLT